MNDQRHELPLEEVASISLYVALRTHLCGCLIILIWIMTKTLSPVHLFGVFVLMGTSLIVPLMTAAVVAEVVVRLRRYLSVPVPLFTRVCVIVVECACFGWVIILMRMLTPFGGEIDPPTLTIHR